jgi:uncharacterized protein (DUF433 family)
LKQRAAKRFLLKRSQLAYMMTEMATPFKINDEVLERPAYSPAVAARYVGVPYQTLRYWTLGRGPVGSIIQPADRAPLVLSFANLLECHVLNALRTKYSLLLPKVRAALETLRRLANDSHPLLSSTFRTDGVDLFIGEGALLNVSQGGQYALREVIDLYLERIEWQANVLAKFYPFVANKGPGEPKIISITPTIAFGRSVIDGTGISTAVIASRFWARENPLALAGEYGRTQEEILEAIRWEGDYQRAA